MLVGQIRSPKIQLKSFTLLFTYTKVFLILGFSFRHKVAAGSERVVTMLPNNAIVETVYKVARFMPQLFFAEKRIKTNANNCRKSLTMQEVVVYLLTVAQ